MTSRLHSVRASRHSRYITLVLSSFKYLAFKAPATMVQATYKVTALFCAGSSHRCTETMALPLAAARFACAEHADCSVRGTTDPSGLEGAQSGLPGYYKEVRHVSHVKSACTAKVVNRFWTSIHLRNAQDTKPALQHLAEMGCKCADCIQHSHRNHGSQSIHKCHGLRC